VITSKNQLPNPDPQPLIALSIGSTINNSKHNTANNIM